MEPLSLLSSIVSTALTLKNWLDNHKSKNEHLKALFLTTERVHHIVGALAEGQRVIKTSDTYIVAALKGLAEALALIKDHLAVWREKKRFSASRILSLISPASVLDGLRDDERLLIQQLHLLSLALSVSTFLGDKKKERAQNLGTAVLGYIKNPHVKEFWGQKIGNEVSCCPGDEFCRAVGEWLHLSWSKSSQDALLLRLDEYGIGGVTPSSLENFVSGQTLERAVLPFLENFERDADPDSSLPPDYRPIARNVNDAIERWLVWVEDKPENNTQEINIAQTLGMSVFCFVSAATVKTWLALNEEKARQLDRYGRLRFVSNNSRWEDFEPNNTGRNVTAERDFLDPAAGDTILRYLRGRQYKAPVLVYCYSSLPNTRYVLSYDRAGSTSSLGVCISFIKSLARDITNDTDWEGYYSYKPRPAHNQSEETELSDVEQPTRLSRFAESSSVAMFCTASSRYGILRPFYSGSGEEVANRMAEVRKAITHIRTHWHEYRSFVRDLRLSFESTIEDAFIFDVIPTVTEWADRRASSSTTEESYTILKLYTMDYGYRLFFRIINEAFRADNLTDNLTRLRSAVFLIELLNIDMFNYIYKAGGSLDFTGTVYRGLCVNEESLHEFRNLTEKPVRGRFWAVPLGMFSCSGNESVARKFAEIEVAADQNLHAVLLRIQVFNMDPELLNIYRKRYPTSVVTTLCAVPIWDLSLHSEEEEVLLRGPFFQLIRMQSVPSTQGGLIHYVDAAMLNTNRDHPSTMELDEAEGAKARALFSCLVGISRAKICKRLSEDYGLVQDSKQYDNVLIEEYEKLSILDRTLTQ